MFESLLGFVAQLSVVLWSLVTLTAVIRLVGIRIYRRSAARTARVDFVAPSAAVPAAAAPTTTAEIDLVQPAASQLTDAGLVRLGLFGSTAAEKDAVLVPAELVDVLTTDAVTNATFNKVLQQAEAPAAVAASVKVARRPPRNRPASQSARRAPVRRTRARARHQLHGGVSMDIALVSFWLFAGVSILYVVHFGLYLVGANFYDVLQQRRKGMRSVPLPVEYEAKCAATATWTRRALPEGPGLVSIAIAAHNEEPVIVRRSTWSLVTRTPAVILDAYATITAYTLLTVWMDENLSARERARPSIYAPTAYFLFYIMDLVQLTAAFRCIARSRGLFRRSELNNTWKSPQRSGSVAVVTRAA